MVFSAEDLIGNSELYILTKFFVEVNEMITLYSGTPGSGKSLHIAQRIYYSLRRKNSYVIANFDINKDFIPKCVGQFDYVPNDELKPNVLFEKSKSYWGDRRVKEDTILLVIDECQLVFNAREWSQAGRPKWLQFFTQHRKLGYEVVLLAQFDLMIDKQIRSLIEYNCVHRKVSNFGIQGKFLSLFALGKLFVCVKIWYPLDEKIGSDFFVAHKKYYQIYDTYNMFDIVLDKDSDSDPNDEKKKK